MKINLLFSMVGPLFDASLEEGFARIAQWVVLNERGGRLFVDAVGEAAAVGVAFQALDYLGRAPVVIGAWTPDGAPVEGYPFNADAFHAVAPPDLTTWGELHQWAGWALRQLPEGTP